MRKIISLICFLLPALAFAAQSETIAELRSDAPDRYTVVKGDTLWDISGKFFKDPWKWPNIWGMNKDTIKDPHWIYPGDIIILDRTTGMLGINQAGGSGNEIVKLSPKAREEASSHNAILSIPASAIEPFLSQPLVVEENQLANAPTFVGLREGRVILGVDDIGYVRGLNEEKGKLWQVYRSGKAYVDPDTEEILGREAIYLGDVNVTKFGPVSTVYVTKIEQEIGRGDQLIVPAEIATNHYLPRAPEEKISAKIISVYGGVSQAGSNTVVTINKGMRDGLENGHVLALYKKGNVAKYDGQDYALPDERYGLLFVFRIFDKVSYALVMQTSLPVQLLDRAQTP